MAVDTGDAVGVQLRIVLMLGGHEGRQGTAQQASIAPFKVPLEEHIWQSDKPLPRLGTQKIDKRSVRKAYVGDPVAA